jgi:hypothetical protein
MSIKPIADTKRVEQILEDAQVLLNICGNTFEKPSQAWYACLVASAILTAELRVPLETFFEGFESAYTDAMKSRYDDAMGGQSYDH